MRRQADRGPALRRLQGARRLATWENAALNGAVAVAVAEGPEAALLILGKLDLDSYHPFHPTRADLLRRLCREPEAVAAYAQAVDLAPTDAEREFLGRGRSVAQ